ncbi:hypothetical protein D3C72_1712510 [compost metagenome]
MLVLNHFLDIIALQHTVQLSSVHPASELLQRRHIHSVLHIHDGNGGTGGLTQLLFLDPQLRILNPSADKRSILAQ